MTDATAKIVTAWVTAGLIPALITGLAVSDRSTDRQTFTAVALAWLFAPISAAIWILIGLWFGAREMAFGIAEWKRELLPARPKKIAPRVPVDPILEAAKREVEAIAPEEP